MTLSGRLDTAFRRGGHVPTTERTLDPAATDGELDIRLAFKERKTPLKTPYSRQRRCGFQPDHPGIRKTVRFRIVLTASRYPRHTCAGWCPISGGFPNTWAFRSELVLGRKLALADMQDEHRDGDRDDGAGNDQDALVRHGLELDHE